ncbi:MAG: N-formylglutamate amidohydrolase [Desulfobacula sp.]|uniref:N-formylglutamate amidohydrolase n=1 Tax=Desulfobacula sp. TaxID=2593537 RepID=UPI0025BB5100|nr:N-formylglutamate amidohydrolase [Desulfobacula sp.]MCD4721926.1 N-formylglutamate amidohydrolase [Desulfobacula sp.]
MQTLSEKEIFFHIRRQEVFAAVIDTGAFSIRIDRYVPAICTAIHAGDNIRDQIADRLLLDARERKYEEDPYTGDMLASFPIVLQALDSRYQYDLNRSPEECIYEEAWGKKVWSRPLTVKERRDNISLHESYYRVLHTLLAILEKRFSRCIVYDLHSYNYKRIATTAPLFNIGTHFIDRKLYQPVLEHLKKRLLLAEFPNIENGVAFDEVFQGRGYQAAFIHENHSQSLCVPLEVKKMYMDETTGDPYPLILEAITETLKQAFSYNASYFTRRFAGGKVIVSNQA